MLRSCLVLGVVTVAAAVDQARSRASLRQKLHGDNIDGGLNNMPLWEPDMDVSHPEHNVALMEDHTKMLKRARHHKKKISWAPFGDYRIAVTDLVPKSDPMKPEFTSEAEDLPVDKLPQTLMQLGLTLNQEQKSKITNSMETQAQMTVSKQFVYPRMDFESTIFSGTEDVAVTNYLKHGGFRYTIGGKDLVANRAVTLIGEEQCAHRAYLFADRFCPNNRFPRSVPQENWRPFNDLQPPPSDITVKGKHARKAAAKAAAEKKAKYSGISYQYIGAHAKEDLFDPDDYPNDPRASHFGGAFLFKKEGQAHYEWRCQDTGFGFLKQKDLHFHLGVVKNNKKTDPHQHATLMAGAPKMLMHKMHKMLQPVAAADYLSDIQAAKKLAYVYAKEDSIAECTKQSHAPAACLEANGGFEMITAGGTVLKIAATPAMPGEDEGAPFAFTSASCPGVLLSEKLKTQQWHSAPLEFAHHGTQMMFLTPDEAHKTGVFGSCHNDKRVKEFSGAFVFKAMDNGEEVHSWRCLDAAGEKVGLHSHHDRFRNANSGEQRMVDNMVDDLSSGMGGAEPSGMVEESIDAIPNDQEITIEEKHDWMADLKREFPGMKVSNHPI